MKKIMYLASGAIICLLLILPVYLWQNKKLPNNQMFDVASQSLSGPVFSKLSINKVEEGAFGKINASQTANPAATGLGGGGGTATLETSARANIASDSVSEKMIAPAPMSYKYIYKGDKIDLSNISGEVLKRVKGVNKSAELAKSISGANLGLINAGAFSDLNMYNMMIAEDHDLGYLLTVNFEDNSVSVSENWNKWQSLPYTQCRDEQCWEKYRVRLTDVLPDDLLISMSNAFLQTYSVDISNYGEPEVDNRWREEYQKTENKDTAWIPESMSVIYPLTINDETVYDEWGNKQGLSVNVNIRARKVSGFYGLQAQQYDSSNYEVVNDKQKVLDVLAKGGRNQWLYSNGGEVKEVEVGDPELIKVKVYQSTGSQTDELIVPALKFPVKEGQADVNIWQKNIIVPLIKDLLDQNDNGGGPILMKAATSAILESVPATESAIDTMEIK